MTGGVNQAGVLSLAPYPPFLICPPVSGGAMHIVKNLAGLGETGKYSITLLFPALSQGHISQVTGYLKNRPGFHRVKGVVIDKEWNGAVEDRDRVPDGAIRLYGSRIYREALISLLNEKSFDIVVVETSYMAWTVPLVREIQPRARVVLDLQNAEHLIHRRVVENSGLGDKEREKYLFEYHKTIDWEKKFWPQFDYCMAVSPLEAGIFSRHAPGVPVGIIVAGGGVDTVSRPVREVPGVGPEDISFVGTMWYPNVHGFLWFIERVLPLVKKVFPRSRLHIIGSGRLPGRAAEIISRHESVVFWGQQEDERSIIAAAGAFVVPLFIGAGVRIKIMTAWALGAPVVSTPIGAEGLMCTHGSDILIAENPEKMASYIIRVLSDARLRRTLAQNGRNLVCRLYSEAAAKAGILKAFQSVMEKKGFTLNHDGRD